MRGKFSKVAAIAGLFILVFSPGTIKAQRPVLATPSTPTPSAPAPEYTSEVRVGAERMNRYLPFLQGKRVGIVANQSSLVGGVHLVDTLRSRGVEIAAIFSPEHGFRGKADAGEAVSDERDPETGIPIISLYGPRKIFPPSLLEGVDVLLFDLQDVGARFYTYVATMHYSMSAASSVGIQFILLDRPNPNGYYVDGPMNKLEKPSFIAMHPVPVVHGMTLGEYAQMLVGEKWVPGADDLDLTIVPCAEYNHKTRYELPVPPSPNLRSKEAINLYPSLCFFEGTTVSVGRGTDTPFEVVGAPFFPESSPHQFVPMPSFGAAHPKWEGDTCYGYHLAAYAPFLWEQQQLNIFWVMDAYRQVPESVYFWKADFFDLLAGGPQLREQIVAGWTEAEIRQSWSADLAAFSAIRRKYLIYP